MYSRVRCIVFFGTPHQGTSLQALEPLLGGTAAQSKASIFEDMKPNSEILMLIGQTLRSATHLKIATCIEQQKSPNSVHVAENEARAFSASERIILLNSYHRDMNKFGHADEEGYQAVLGFLEEVLVHHRHSKDLQIIADSSG